MTQPSDIVTKQPAPAGYRSPLRRMLYDSPLHKPWGKGLFALIMAALIYLSGTVWRSWLTPLSNSWIVLLGISFAFLGSIVGLAWLRYLDRREPESWYYWLGALLFALLFTVAPAAFFNDKSPTPLLTVGFVEEFWKVMPLLLLVFFAPAMVNGVRDGLIYGALGGFAFNIVEIANYFLRVSYPEQGIAGLSEQLARLSFWGIGNHVIWSMLVGAGIGLAVQSPSRRTRILAPLGAYLLAAVTHDLQDMGGGALLTLAASGIVLMLQGVDAAQMGAGALQSLAGENMRPIMQIEAVMINIIILPVIIYGLVRSGDWERGVVRRQLADEVGGAITAAEYAGVKAEKRFRIRRVPGYSRRTGHKIRSAQNNLAFHKEYLRRHNRTAAEDPLAAYYRQAIARARGSAPERGVNFPKS